jgi:hypothetical protein
MTDGFLGRWSKRKLEVKEGKPVEAEPGVPPPQLAPEREGSEVPAAASTAVLPSPAGQGQGGSIDSEAPPLTLEDVKALNAESDFSRFTAPNVAPEVKNAAMKKLFSDPHYNIMDRLDVYIDDYSQADPMPQSMVRQLASVKFLGLFDQDEKAEAQAAHEARERANNPTPQTVAQSQTAPPAVPEPFQDHADPDLRLQQDDAAPGEDPGHGAR